jgi:MCP family monocarboxylic acid transporter-like MFS transporter 13
MSGSFFYGFSAFFNPIIAEFKWSAAATATALSLQRTEAGIAGPFVGFLVDRYGARGVMLVGTVITSLGFFYLARIHSLPTFYLAFGIVALGFSMASMITTTAVVGNWFLRLRSRAMTVAFAGGGMGGIMVPAIVWGISSFGWRAIMDWIALITLVIGIPVALIMRHRPENYGYLPDGRQPHTEETAGGDPSSLADDSVELEEPDFTVRQILRSVAFWQLTMSMGVVGMVMGTVVVFSIPAMESFGLSSATAGVVVLFLSVFNLAGRFILGFLADKVDKRRVLAFTYLLIGLGSLAFATIQRPWQIVLFLFLYPPGHGGTVPVRFALLADYFGRRSFGTLVGLTMTLTAVFGIIGPVFTGWMFDVTGSYRMAFIIMGLLVLPTVPVTLMVKQPVRS